MKKLKKLSSIFMALVMVLICLSVSPITANASMMTTDIGTKVMDDIVVDQGGSATLTVDPASLYQEKEATYYYWSKITESGSQFISGSENQSTLTLSDIQEGGIYLCTVDYSEIWEETDEGWNPVVPVGNFIFHVDITNGFTCSEGQDINISSSESFLLEVTASCDDGDISYNWEKAPASSGTKYNEGSYANFASVPNGTSNVLEIPPVSAVYRCIVKDKFNNTRFVVFNVTVDNNFTVATKETTYTLTLGEQINLSVEASCNSGTLHYKWFDEYVSSFNDRDYDIKSTDAVYTVTVPSDVEMTSYENFKTSYYCIVYDDYENYEIVPFRINLTDHLVCTNRNVEISVTPGETVTLTPDVTSDSGIIKYEWAEWIEQSDGSTSAEKIPGETNKDFVVGPINECRYYYCYISDPFGNTTYADFTISIENEFSAKAKEPTVMAKVGDTVTLETVASCKEGELTYKWSTWDETLEETSNQLTLDISSETNQSYTCEVSDIYGNKKNVSFNVIVASGDAEFSSDKINLLCWDSDSENRYNCVIEAIPELKDKVNILNLNAGGLSSEYIGVLASIKDTDKVIFAQDKSLIDFIADNVPIATMDELGLTSSDYKNAYPITKATGTVNDKLVAVTPTVCPTVLIYNADVAKNVLGANTPAEVEKLVNTPEKFYETAERLKEAGIYALADQGLYYSKEYDDTTFAMAVKDEEELARGINFGKTLAENGYVPKKGCWTEEWSQGMGSDYAFAYTCCPWMEAVYSMNMQEYGNNANIDMCTSPVPFEWGGTYYSASKACVGDEDALLLLKSMCCDSDTMYTLTEMRGDLPNNKVTVKKIINENFQTSISLASGQSSIAVYDKAASSYHSESTIQNYTITYILNGGTNSNDNPETYSSDSGKITLTAPTKKGYTFAGWYTESTFTNKITSISGATASDITLYAKWTANTYTVKFDGNGSTSGTMANQSFTYGKDTPLNANAFKRTGYTFKGWSTSATGTVEYTNKEVVNGLTTKNKGVVTLYAIWAKTKYTITYNLNDGTNNEANPSYVYYTTNTVTLKDATKKGYIFGGWYSDEALTKKVTQIAKGQTKNITLYAKWTKNTYYIKFNGNGATSGSMATVKGRYATTITLPANAYKRTGYTFKGWATSSTDDVKYANKETVKNLTAVNNKTVTLYAKWAKTKYKVTYNLNGGVNAELNPTNFYYTTPTITLQNPIKSGYTFAGWYSDEAFTKPVTQIIKGTSHNVTLYAKWTKNTYYIKFNGNGATSGTMAKISCKYATTVVLPKNVYKRDGYIFKGWATSSTGEVKYTDNASVRNLTTVNKKTVSLYAVWEEDIAE